MSIALTKKELWKRLEDFEIAKKVSEKVRKETKALREVVLGAFFEPVPPIRTSTLMDCALAKTKEEFLSCVFDKDIRRIPSEYRIDAIQAFKRAMDELPLYVEQREKEIRKAEEIERREKEEERRAKEEFMKLMEPQSKSKKL